MSHAERDNREDRHPIPTWDGSPHGWQRYVEQVRLWKLGENLDVKYSLAARLIGRMSGSARRACINMESAALQPIRGAAAEIDADDVVRQAAVEENLSAGIENVMERLRSVLVPEPMVSRGQAMTDFFKSQRFVRRPGQRMTEFCGLFEEGLERLRQDGA